MRKHLRNTYTHPFSFFCLSGSLSRDSGGFNRWPQSREKARGSFGGRRRSGAGRRRSGGVFLWELGIMYDQNLGSLGVI